MSRVETAARQDAALRRLDEALVAQREARAAAVAADDAMHRAAVSAVGEGVSVVEVARRVGVNRDMIYRWRKAYPSSVD